MFVLGIDPGLTTTGYGAVRRERGRMVPVTVGVIRTSPQERIETRLRELHRDIRSVLDEHRPDVVALEQVFVNRNLQTAMSVARASGVIMLAAAESGVPVVEYTPSSVKAAIAGYGSAPKDQVQKMVASRLRLATAPSPADAADALAIALCHIQSHRLNPATLNAGSGGPSPLVETGRGSSAGREARPATVHPKTSGVSGIAPDPDTRRSMR
jgi:crossover junction endodeoxyribonuclease RuvC